MYNAHISPALDQAFIELTKDTRADAILAALSLNLKQEQGSFDRILGLLSQLESDARDQDHSNVLLWKKTEAQCQVDKFSFVERQDFLDNVVSANQAAAKELASEQLEAKELRESRIRISEVYGSTATQAKEDLAQAKRRCDEGETSLQTALENVRTALDAVKEWTSEPAFIQNQLEKVTKSYEEVKNMKLIIPTNLLERTDSQIKTRLVEWLEDIENVLVNTETAYDGVCNDQSDNFQKLQEEMSELKNKLDEDAKFLDEVIKRSDETLEHVKESAEHFAELANNNQELARQSADWCAVEEKNFNAAHEVVQSQIGVFKDIRSYFIDHYKELSEFIAKKYSKM